MVRHTRRGAVSLASVFCLVGLVTLLASGMVGVFTLNLNMTQKSFNGSIAESEAEAGIAEALYRITDPSGDNIDNDKQPPAVSYGRSGETIRGTITPDLSPEEAYHVVTFAKGTGFPHSTNNTYLDSDTGSLGRTIPDGMFHIVSTGYCRGQYRTIEALVSKPPFPFGLATSGKLVSHDPFVVKGVSSVADLIDEKEDRPGHILCNSTDGVKIGQSDPPRPTYISGFVKSVGPIDIAQPAEVIGGLRPGSDTSTLAKIDVTNFKNQNQPGVVTINDAHFVREQTMDIMYFYSGPQLTYERAVKLKQALLYVEGDLVIKGPVTGEGLIVVDGNVTFGSGTILDGSNKMAILASGDVTIRGANNYFTGLVYSGGNFNASNVTIVGNTIVNSSDPEKGQAELENVTFISNTETADMTITVTSSTHAVGQNNADDGVIPLGINHNTFGLPHKYDYSDNGGGNLEGWISLDNQPEDYVDYLVAGLWQPLEKTEPEFKFPELGQPPAGLGTEGIWEQAKLLYDAAKLNENFVKEYRELQRLPGETSAEFEKRKGDKESEYAKHKESFDTAALDLITKIFNHKRTHADGDGIFDDGTVDMNIKIDHRFNLNEYLPESERVKIAYWRVHHSRL